LTEVIAGRVANSSSDAIAILEGLAELGSFEFTENKNKNGEGALSLMKND
jgi:hypothetical protein